MLLIGRKVAAGAFPNFLDLRFFIVPNSSLSLNEAEVLAKGVYFLRVQYRNQVIQQKLFK
jgi:hypothetical protein